MSESIRLLRNPSNAGEMVELLSSIQVSATFIFGAFFKVIGFLSLTVPDKWWAKQMHWLRGMFKAFGNFSTQNSASCSDFGLSPLNTMTTP